MNPHGGSLSEGATRGTGFLRESVVQLRGQAGDRQVAGAQHRARTHRRVLLQLPGRRPPHGMTEDASTELRDYLAWHDAYDTPGSSLHLRLLMVQGSSRRRSTRHRPGPIRVLSLCAGQGRDIVTVARRHRRGGDVVGRLVELDPRNVEMAPGADRGRGAHGSRGARGRRRRLRCLRRRGPADVVLACGIFGNITEEEVERTVRFLPSLCAPGAHVIWTRAPRRRHPRAHRRLVRRRRLRVTRGRRRQGRPLRRRRRAVPRPAPPAPARPPPLRLLPVTRGVKARKSARAAVTRSGTSVAMLWPECGSVTRRAFGLASTMRTASSGVRMSLSPPRSSSVGTASACQNAHWSSRE